MFVSFSGLLRKAQLFLFFYHFSKYAFLNTLCFPCPDIPGSLTFSPKLPSLSCSCLSTMCLTYANLNDMTFPFLSSIVLLGAAAEVSLFACPAVFLLNANKIALVHLTAPIKKHTEYIGYFFCCCGKNTRTKSSLGKK